MRQLPHRRQGPGGLLMQIVAFLVGLGVLGVSLVLGAFLLAGFLGLALIAGFVIWLRLMWLTRRARRGAGEEEFIETEYRVVRRSERDRREP